jgi:hypothetical protein
LSPFNLPLRIIILLPLQKTNNRAPCLFFTKSLFFLSLGISSKSRQLTPFSIKSENVFASYGRTSVEKDYFLFDEKDEANTFSDFIENGVSCLDLLEIPRERKNKDLVSFNRFYELLVFVFKP